MPIRNRLVLFAALTLGMATAPADGRAADPDPSVTAEYVSAARKSVEKVSSLVENLQDDIIEEMAGEKEKTLFRLADQVQSELDLLDKTLAGKDPTREALYKQFDRSDSKVAALVKAISTLSPKRPALTRETERVRVQNDDLHYVLSVGDGTQGRQKQVLVRQAQSMKSAAKQFVAAADYAILDRPGRARFMDVAKAFAEECESFETLSAAGDLDTRKKAFATLTEVWGQVVQGFRLLSPREDYHIARLGFRVDQYHRRLFELLKMPGKRPELTINL